MPELAIPLLEGDPTALDTASRDDLLNLFKHYRTIYNEVLRRAILEHDRIDLLATQVLGYEVKPFHMSMLLFQFYEPHTLQLAYRGSGKSTLLTIAKTIHYLLKDPNLRIILASKTTGNAKGFLREIKAHFESNQRLIEIFGEFYDPRKVAKWDEIEIEIVPRTSTDKQPSVMCCGAIDATLASHHADIILSDDLVDEENSRTKYMRDKMRSWFYQTLDPCLEAPDPDIPHRGEHHMVGTRYHFDDLYGSLMANELAKSHQIFPALDWSGKSPWPERHPPKWFEAKKRKSGVVIFNCQFLCDTEAMKGEVFQYDDCQIIDDNKLPTGLRVYQGTDLAVSEKETRDSAQFATVVIGIDKSENVYVLDFYLGHITFPRQIDKALSMYERHDPIRAAVESNAYQRAFYQEIKHRDKNYRFIPIHTDKDKMTRALKLTPRFEDKRIFFRKNMETLIDQFVLFPGYRYRDGLDAFDLAIRASRKKRKRRQVRATEPGLI